MATALIKFTQGATTDTAGRAVVGVAGAAVTVESGGDNTGVTNYTFTLLDVPEGSALTEGVNYTGALHDGGLFTPDVPGTYNVGLTIAPSGLTDSRDFIVPETDGNYVPAFESDEKSFNYGGQLKGYARAVNRLLRMAGKIGKVLVDAVLPTTSGMVARYDASLGKAVWQQLSLDDLTAAFAISSFAKTGGTTVEVGQAVNTPAFTMTYAGGPPTSATFTDVPGTHTLTTPFTSYTSTDTWTSSAYGQTRAFTLSAVKGALTRNSTITLTALQKVYYGKSSSAGPYTETEVKALATSVVTSTSARDIALNLGAGEYGVYGFRTAYAGVNQSYFGILPGGAVFISTISVTNVNGFVENYDVWRTTNPALGVVTWSWKP